jgi:hypothetical protein
MSRLIKIAEWTGAPRAIVIFVHGRGGHAYDTWRRAPDDNSFWPVWLAEDVPGLAVYTLAYEAPPSNWLGTAMPLQDRAVNLLEILLSTLGWDEVGHKAVDYGRLTGVLVEAIKELKAKK